MRKIKALILAAGKGGRMKSSLPKVAHKVCGKEMVNHVIDASKLAGVDEVITILGHGIDDVKKILSDDIKFSVQRLQLGTGHAVLSAINHVNEDDTVLVLCGDTPLIKPNTLKNLINYHEENCYHTTVLTTTVQNPKGYGRIIRDKDNNFLRIIEDKDANEIEKEINEINSGIYCFNGKSLINYIKMINNSNIQGEYYLTDIIQIMRFNDLSVGAFNGSTIEELMGVNSRIDLSKAEETMRRRINIKHMTKGITIIDPNSTYIESNVEIGKDTIIYPGVMLKGNTKIGSNCIIEMNSSIENSIIGDNTQVKNSTIVDSIVGENSTVGPYAYLRPKSNIGNNVKIGDFVEVKNATIEDNSKASHLSYIGDAHIGKDVNIGCGVVFANYDGKNKFKSVVKDGAFIGSNSNLVAPVTVYENGYIATGSTITDDVPENSLAIARERQVVKKTWVKNHKSK